MKILIAGLSKTGTTGLYFKIKHSIPGPVRTLFEPRHFKPLPEDEQTTVLAKILLGRPELLEIFGDFDRKIGLIRDPRDTMISRMLYRTGFHGGYIFEDAHVNRLKRLFQAKEERGSRVSLMDILRLHCELSGYRETIDSFRNDEQKRLDKIQLLVADNPEIHTIKYEDFVADDLISPEAYLGFPLNGDADADDEGRHVARTKASGDWKNWFLAEDVEFFRPVFEPFLSRNGYDLSWDRPQNAQVLPANGSQYFQKLVDAQRAFMRPKKLEMHAQV